MADEEQNEQTENEQPEENEQAAEETVSAPEGPVAPAAETEEQPAEAPAVEAPAAEAPEPKRKRKRLPRSLRHRHSKAKRERSAERKAITRVPKPEHPRGRRQERRGVVVSSGMDKTIVVRRSTKFHAHDEENQAKVGDVVRIVETRPLSKTKNWRLAEIVEVAQ